MAVYAIGDIQGCFEPLQRLLETINFDPTADRLLIAGDLVNRGPQSVEVLRLLKSLGDRAACVLGNHDLALLAVAGGHQSPSDGDTHDSVLQASDREPLLDWLRHRPLLHQEPAFNVVMTHAGLPPQWTVDEAVGYAREVETVLQGPDYHRFLTEMYGNQPRRWQDDLTGIDRWRYITNAFTRMRFCEADGALALEYKGPPESAPNHLKPWFRWPHRRAGDVELVFGHWAALGLHREPGINALDSGCVWGGRLTALRLDPPMQVFSVDCRRQQ